MIFKHKGFWQPMDTLREKNLLTSLWEKKIKLHGKNGSKKKKKKNL